MNPDDDAVVTLCSIKNQEDLDLQLQPESVEYMPTLLWEMATLQTNGGVDSNFDGKFGAQRREILNELHEKGLVHRPCVDNIKWVLSDAGISSLEVYNRFTKRAPACSPRIDIPIEEANIWELVLHLTEHGWEHKFVHRHALLAPYDPKANPDDAKK
eukprot:6904937-Karenia_brevis.AAC.1